MLEVYLLGPSKLKNVNPSCLCHDMILTVCYCLKVILDVVENYPGVKTIKSDGKKQVNLPDIIPQTVDKTTKKIKLKKKTLKLKSPFVTLLRRESTKERIFHPPNR